MSAPVFAAIVAEYERFVSFASLRAVIIASWLRAERRNKLRDQRTGKYFAAASPRRRSDALPRLRSAKRRRRCDDPGRAVRVRGGDMIAVPSAAFGASTVKPAEIDLLCRMQSLRLERADDLGPAPPRPREAS